MKNIKNILRELWSYLSIRQTGKTSLLKAGTDNYDRPHWVLVPTMKYGKTVLKTSNENQKLIGLNNLEKLYGSRDPLIIDQETNVMIFSMALDHINLLEMDRNVRDKVIMELAELCEMYQEDSHIMEKHIMDGLQIPFWNFVKRISYRKKSLDIIQSAMNKHQKYMKGFERIKKVYGIEI
jgi:hypothetical protein